jgi:hypothetical protein
MYHIQCPAHPLAFYLQAVTRASRDSSIKRRLDKIIGQIKTFDEMASGKMQSFLAANMTLNAH